MLSLGRRESARHEGVSCDGCGVTNFSGIRHKCLVCFDYDLCHACTIHRIATKDHQSDHPMQSIVPMSHQSLDDFDSDLDIIPPLNGLDDLSSNYTCPYCTQIGFTENSLFDHILALHVGDTSLVACPICASKPGSDPNFRTRDLFVHMEVRHHRKSAIKKARTTRRTGGRLRDSSDGLADLIAQMAQEKKGTPKSPLSSSTTSLKSSSEIPPTGLRAIIAKKEENAKSVTNEQDRALRAVFVQDLLMSTLPSTQRTS